MTVRYKNYKRFGSTIKIGKIQGGSGSAIGNATGAAGSEYAEEVTITCGATVAAFSKYSCVQQVQAGERRRAGLFAVGDFGEGPRVRRDGFRHGLAVDKLPLATAGDQASIAAGSLR